jgi:hypothetical protein
VFTDQQWINLVPGMFRKVEILEHPGLNVNFHSARVRRPQPDGDGFRLAQGEPLVFFHFHKFRLGQGAATYFNGHLDAETAAALHKQYGNALVEKGWSENVSIGLGRLAGGGSYPAVFRRAYAAFVQHTGIQLENCALDLERFARRLIDDPTGGEYLRVWAYQETRGGHHTTPETLLATYRGSLWLRLKINVWFYLFGPAAVPFPIRWVDTTASCRLVRRAVGICWRRFHSAVRTLRGLWQRKAAALAPLGGNTSPVGAIES